MRRALVCSSALMLTLMAACGRSEDATSVSPSAAPTATVAEPAPVDYRRPLNLLGNEPFWSLRIRPDGLTFSAPSQDDVVASNPGPKISDGQAVWTGDAKGQPVTATVTLATCQDTMAGLIYPFKARVEIGGKTLEGCAAYADAMPREGG